MAGCRKLLKMDLALEKLRKTAARAEFEREYILRKLIENEYNVSKTAEQIGIERTSLHRKIKSYGIEISK
jgi:two-component system nitrogen regulation response regulator NtrX